MPWGGTFRGAALLVKRSNSKWSLTNEPEIRFTFYILVKVGPAICRAGTVPGAEKLVERTIELQQNIAQNGNRNKLIT